jgi:pyrroline-5-carboxylate reductase
MERIGLIGCGKMGAALARGLVRSDAAWAGAIVAADPHEPAREALARETGVRVTANNAEAASFGRVIVVCVKPGDAAATLLALRGQLAGKLAVSIAAGVRLAALEAAAGPGVAVARVMPNTPALIGRGAAAYALGSGATEEHAAMIERIFATAGLIERVKEEWLDAVTGLSGSGPAYVQLVIDALADGGVLMGLPRDLALRLAAQTVAGSAEMVLVTGQHPGQLRDQVASPGGTTIAGIEALERGGLRAALIAAVRAAAERSKELGG